jgi:hypothetical protein
MIKQVIIDVPNPTLEVHRQHMEDAQSTLVGIDAEWLDDEDELDEFNY